MLGINAISNLGRHKNRYYSQSPNPGPNVKRMMYIIYNSRPQDSTCNFRNTQKVHINK